MVVRPVPHLANVLAPWDDVVLFEGTSEIAL